jgi:hypothetical protein
MKHAPRATDLSLCDIVLRLRHRECRDWERSDVRLAQHDGLQSLMR